MTIRDWKKSYVNRVGLELSVGGAIYQSTSELQYRSNQHSPLIESVLVKTKKYIYNINIFSLIPVLHSKMKIINGRRFYATDEGIGVFLRQFSAGGNVGKI